MTDWNEWHRDYTDPASDLSRRRRAVQAHIRAWLDSHPSGHLRVVSACAGDGRDILEVLASRDDPSRVGVVLIETDPDLARKAEELARACDLDQVDVRRADAGSTDAYAGAVPADLVMMCGVFGNASDHDLRATIATMPQLCAEGAWVIWTRGSFSTGDLAPTIRAWFEELGFEEVAFDLPEDATYRVGSNRFDRRAMPLVTGHTFFTFNR